MTVSKPYSCRVFFYGFLLMSLSGIRIIHLIECARKNSLLLSGRIWKIVISFLNDRIYQWSHLGLDFLMGLVSNTDLITIIDTWLLKLSFSFSPRFLSSVTRHLMVLEVCYSCWWAASVTVKLPLFSQYFCSESLPRLKWRQLHCHLIGFSMVYIFDHRFASLVKSGLM